jgi:hypothetical protein
MTFFEAWMIGNIAGTVACLWLMVVHSRSKEV